MNEITIFAAEAVAITFKDRKDNTHSVSPEGALFKGGAALAALKDATMKAAANKAANGKYRAASDILAAAFSATAKKFDEIVGTPWANKSNMASFLSAIERAAAERAAAGKLTGKQEQAMAFVKALRTIPALAGETAAPVTVEAVAVEAGETAAPVTVEPGLRRAA